jgi:UDP-glucose 4-epimerase
MEISVVTGGCGFIGSHLVDHLMGNGNEVNVFDNLSSGNLANLASWKTHSQFHFAKKDLRNASIRLPNCDVVYHLAANCDVRTGTANPKVHFEQNILSTYNLLEAVRNSNAKLFVFTSTSTVYGEARLMPTPENYGPLIPISVYGASKLASESLISSYAHTYGFRAIIFRLANIIGARSSHGIIFDFMQKLRKYPTELEILGDGSQSKSYLHIKDCVDGIFVGVDNAKGQVSIFNIGSEDQIDVLKIAKIISRELGYLKVEYKFNIRNPDGRGWPGDVKFMRLDVSRLKSFGWTARLNSEGAVIRTVHEVRIG